MISITPILSFENFHRRLPPKFGTSVNYRFSESKLNENDGGRLENSVRGKTNFGRELKLLLRRLRRNFQSS